MIRLQKKDDIFTILSRNGFTLLLQNLLRRVTYPRNWTHYQRIPSWIALLIPDKHCYCSHKCLTSSSFFRPVPFNVEFVCFSKQELKKRRERNIEGGERGSARYMGEMWFICGPSEVFQQSLTERAGFFRVYVTFECNVIRHLLSVDDTAPRTIRIIVKLNQSKENYLF